MSTTPTVRRRKKTTTVQQSTMMDISSQEEDNNNNNHNKPTTFPEDMPPDLSALVNYHVTPVDELPIIKSIQQVVREFPHMQNNSLTGLPNCEEAKNKFVDDMKALGHDIELVSPQPQPPPPINNNNNSEKPNLPILTNSSSHSTSYTIKQQHYATSEVNPWNQAVFLEKLERLKVPNWYYDDGTANIDDVVRTNQMNQTTLTDLLRRGVMDLPEQHADLESELLAEAGSWTNLLNGSLVEFPACEFGTKCVGHTKLLGEVKGLTRPITLTQILYRNEYMNLLRTGESNYPTRPCVLCMRDILPDIVTCLRKEKMEGGNDLSKAVANFEYKSKQVLQWYRNPRQQPNGYDQNFMLTEEPSEPIIHPIVTLNIAQLECKVLQNGRRYIDQSSILYKPPPLPRSKPELVSAGLQANIEHNHDRCLQLQEPDLDLLRSTPDTRHLFKDETTIDRVKLETFIANNPSRLDLFLLCDQLRFLPRTQQFASTSCTQLCSMNQVACTARLCKMHKHVIRASYFAPLSNKDLKRMCHLFSKVLNTRCQTRKFPVLILRYMSGFKSTHRTVKLLLTLSLLGNYPKLQERPMGASRPLIYQYFMDSEHPLFLILAKQCSLVIENSLREFLIYSVDMHPWLKKHLIPLMNLHQFTSVVRDSMDSVRRYFGMFIAEHRSALSYTLREQHPEALKRVLWDLNHILYPSHTGILEISYKRPNLNPSSFVTATRKYFPMLTIPTQEELEEAKLEAQTDEQLAEWIVQEMQKENQQAFDELLQTEIEDEEDSYHAVEMAQLQLPDQGLQSVLKLVAEQEQTVEQSDLPFWKLIKQPVYNALRAVVQRERPTETGAYQRCLPWLVHFGVSEEVIEYTNVVINHYEHASMSVAKLKKGFTMLQRYEPYAYTLLQLLAELIKQATRHFRWYQLPYHYLSAQINALCSRFEVTEQNKILLASNLTLVFCEVCGTEYSLIRVFVNKNTGKKVYNQYYRCGFRDVVVDYRTNEMYCNRNKCNVNGKCGEKPLTQFPILGRAFWKDGKCFMICGQPQCGLKMEYDPSQCIVNRYGAACSDCTQKYKDNPPAYEKLVTRYTDPSIERRCFKCHNKLEQHHLIHLLPAPGMYLCKWHVNNWLMHQIEEKFGTGVMVNPVELQQFMIQKMEETKLKFKDKNNERNKQKLKNSKRIQSFKRVRR